MDLCYEYLTSQSDIASLDFTEDDGADPLGVQEFASKKALDYHNNKLSTVRVVKYHGNVVAYFAVSMSAISIEDLDSIEKVEKATPLRYPAMLIGQLGVDKKYRGKGIGKEICKFCLGLAQDIGDRIACRYVILQTNTNKTKIYDGMKFTKSPKKPQNNKVWMYRRIGQ